MHCEPLGAPPDSNRESALGLTFNPVIWSSRVPPLPGELVFLKEQIDLLEAFHEEGSQPLNY